MQEDSFLLRAQQVDLERLADERTPLITSSAPFLSKVERHLLDCYREEVAYAWEVQLYESVIQIPSIRQALPARLRSRDDALSPAQLPYSAQIAQRAGSSQDAASYWTADWELASHSALCLRRRSPTIVNSALGHLALHQTARAHSLLLIANAENPSKLGTWQANYGLLNSLRGNWSDALDAYLRAWGKSDDDIYLYSAALAATAVRTPSCLPKDATSALARRGSEGQHEFFRTASSKHFRRPFKELKKLWSMIRSPHPNPAVQSFATSIFDVDKAA